MELTIAAIEWNYWTVAGAAAVLIAAVNIPAIKPVAAWFLARMASGSAAPTVSTVITQDTVSVVSNTKSCCGKRAEAIAVVRELYTNAEATEAVKAMDAAAATVLFDAKPAKEA